MALYMDSDLGRSYVAQVGSAISGGELACAFQSTEITTSTADPFDDIRVGPIKAAGASDAAKFVGIAQETAGPGSKVTILTKGIFRLRLGSAVAVVPGDTIVPWASNSNDGTEVCLKAAEVRHIGIVLSPANGADEYILALLNL